MSYLLRALVSFLLLVALLVSAYHTAYADTQDGIPILVTETGHTLAYGFRQFYDQYGGVAIFGLPITEVYLEDGRPVQYFERARFEWHAEIPGVQIGHLGRWAIQGRENEPAFQWKNASDVPSDALFLPESGHSLRGEFRTFWQERGREHVFGYPISEEHTEQTLVQGQPYTITVQYFERAKFELHTEHASAPPVMLGLLGRDYLAAHPAPESAARPVTSAAVAWDAVRPTQVRMPRIGVNTNVIEAGYTGNEWDVPRFSAAHYWPLSAYPGTGGNIVIAAHAGYSGILFNELPQAQVGDEVFVQVAGYERRYIVRDVFTVLPYETWVLHPTSAETLTLYTCYPIGVYTHRLVVRAQPEG